MKHFISKQLLLASICCALIPVAYADSVVVTESLTDSVKCTTAGCSVVPSGKFDITARISGQTFDDNGIYKQNITDATTIDIAIGDFIFSSTLGGADSHSLNNKVAANWSESHDVCANKQCTFMKSVKHTKISLNTNANGAILKISGTSTDAFGSRVFADICDVVGDGQTVTKTATLTVDGIPISTDLTVQCSVQSKTVIKSDVPFELSTTRARVTYNQ